MPNLVRRIRENIQKRKTLARNRINRAGIIHGLNRSRANLEIEKRIELKVPKMYVYKPTTGRFRKTQNDPSFEYWETRERELRDSQLDLAREISRRFTIRQLRKAAEEDGSLDWVDEKGRHHSLGSGTAQLFLYLINERAIRRKELVGKRKRKQQFLKKEEKRRSDDLSPWH